MIAHAKAWKEQKTIHRDVSELNVVLWSYIDVMGVKQTIGLLIDWDLSKQAEFLALITRPGRSVSQSSDSICNCAYYDPLGDLAVYVSPASPLP